MPTRLILIAILAALAVGVNARVAAADEAPATSVDVKSVFLRYGGGRLPGLWLSEGDGGWRVPLPYVAADACTARLYDLAPSHQERDEPLRPGSAALTLPRRRYAGSHSYRISFTCRRSRVADLLVHLAAR